MFYIVETEQQLKELELLSYKDVFIHPIVGNDKYHPKLTDLVGIYVKPRDCEGVFILTNHEEGFNIDRERVNEVLSLFPTKYTINRKNLLYHFNLEDVQDLSLKYSLSKHIQLDSDIQDSTIQWYYSKYPSFIEINKIIPISILVRYCDNLYNKVKEVIKFEIPAGYEFFNTLATNIYFLIEQNGIGVDNTKFIKINNIKNPEFNLKNNTVYSQYKLTNVTTRPTNSYNSVNFAAIPKKQEFREVFTPKNDYFVEIDFDGYHLRLIGELIKYELTREPAHIQLARQIFNKEQVTEEEYRKAKQVNFQAIYGKIPREHENIKFFKLIKQYIQQLWLEYENKGYITNPISNIKFTSQLQDMNPAKLMNYMIQSIETANNIKVLKQVLGYLNRKKSNVVLYTYDSIIIDLNEKDGEYTLENIKQIMEQDGKYPVKCKESTNLVL